MAMMSRILSQSLSRASLHPSKAASISHHRHRSNKTHQSQLIEVEVDPSSSQSDSTEVITVGIKKLEEAIHSIIVRRAAPDWLPFLPGYSYWVPPQPSSITRQSTGMVEVISKFTSSGGDLLSEDEEMSFTSAKGWPSSTFFIQGTSPVHPISVVEVVGKVQNNEDNADKTSNPEDEGCA